MIRARPDLLISWLEGDSDNDADVVSKRMWLARSFYEAPCEVLLSEQPVLGAALYTKLKENAGAVRFLERGTEIPLLDHALFATIGGFQTGEGLVERVAR